MLKTMSKGRKRKNMLFYCPVNKLVWQYDKTNKIHIHRDMPTYGLKR